MKKIGIDCGDNIGDVTEVMLNSVDEVHAFEPNPHAFQKLSNRFLFNPRVHCYPLAVLDSESCVKLYFHERSEEDEVLWSTGSSLLDFKGNVDKNKSMDVDTVDICKFIKDLDAPVEILKMDIEGVECQIINKLIDTGLVNKIKMIHVELHAKKIPELLEKEKKLKDRVLSAGITNINMDWR